MLTMNSVLKVTCLPLFRLGAGNHIFQKAGNLKFMNLKEQKGKEKVDLRKLIYVYCFLVQILAHFTNPSVDARRHAFYLTVYFASK